MSNWNHKGVTIVFDEGQAKFFATIGNQRMSAGSLDGIKKKIDTEKAKTDSFKPFKVVGYHRYSTGNMFSGDEIETDPKITDDTVVEIVKERSRGEVRHQFSLNGEGAGWNGTGYKKWVVLDTPEARKAIKAYYKIAIAGLKEIHRLKKEIEDARLAIPHLTIEEYLAKGGAK